MEIDELVQQMKARSFPHLRDRMAQKFKEDIADMGSDTTWLVAFLGPEEAAEPSPQTLEWLWDAPLTEMAVHLLWAVEKVSAKRIFTANDKSVDLAIRAVYPKALALATGLKEKEITIPLLQMTSSLLEIISEHGTIDIEIDGKPLRLQAKKPSIFRRIFKFVF